MGDLADARRRTAWPKSLGRRRRSSWIGGERGRRAAGSRLARLHRSCRRGVGRADESSTRPPPAGAAASARRPLRRRPMSIGAGCGRCVVELGRAALRAGVAVADHLLLDLVDLGLDAARPGGAGVSDARGSESSRRDEPPSAASCSPARPSRRTLRSMSNSRLRTKSLRRLRSIIALSSPLA